MLVHSISSSCSSTIKDTTVCVSVCTQKLICADVSVLVLLAFVSGEIKLPGWSQKPPKSRNKLFNFQTVLKQRVCWVMQKHWRQWPLVSQIAAGADNMFRSRVVIMILSWRSFIPQNNTIKVPLIPSEKWENFQQGRDPRADPGPPAGIIHPIWSSSASRSPEVALVEEGSPDCLLSLLPPRPLWS